MILHSLYFNYFLGVWFFGNSFRHDSHMVHYCYKHWEVLGAVFSYQWKKLEVIPAIFLLYSMSPLLCNLILIYGAFRSSIQGMKRVIGTIWILAFVAGTLPLLGWNRYIYEVTYNCCFIQFFGMKFFRVTCIQVQWTIWQKIHFIFFTFGFYWFLLGFFPMFQCLFSMVWQLLPSGFKYDLYEILMMYIQKQHRQYTEYNGGGEK